MLAQCDINIIIFIHRVDGRILQKTRKLNEPQDAWHADPVAQGHPAPIQLCVITHRTEFNREAVGPEPREGLQGGFLSRVPMDHIIPSTT